MAAEPILEARGLGLRTRRGWVFRDIDLTVRAGEHITITGPAASGRTSLLLALAGYFKTSAGTVHRNGTVALGYVPGVHEPEPGLTVAEHVEERLLLLGHTSWLPSRRRREVRRLLDGGPLDPDTLGRDLDVLGQHLLCLTLAKLNRPAVIVVDDVDSGLSTAERERLDEALSATGAALVVAAREAPGPTAVAGPVITLERHQ